MQFRLQSCVDLNVSLLKLCFFWKEVLYTPKNFSFDLQEAIIIDLMRIVWNK